MSNYHLHRILQSHKRAVRCVDLNYGRLISGSIDKNIIVYDAITYEQIAKSDILESEVYSVQVMENGYLAGCYNGMIYQLDSYLTPVLQYQEHTGVISSLSLFGNKFASGSWDGTVKVWNFESNKSLQTFDGHAHAVTVCASVEFNIIASGSQNKSLILIDLTKLTKTKTIENAHDDIIRQIKVQNQQIYTVSNDLVIKIRDLQGGLLNSLQIHSSFIFALAVFNDLLITGGDDKNIIFHKNMQLNQTFKAPSTVWNITFNPQNSDVIACFDNNEIYILTNDDSRIVSPEVLQLVEQQIALAHTPQQGISSEEIKKLPLASSLPNVKGKKEGDIQLFNNNNCPEAHIWQNGTWSKIGDVIGRPDKKVYSGDELFPAGEYDYIFDVENDAGIKTKIPFNDGDNIQTTAEKYCARERLDRILYIDQITQFIQTNSKPQQQFIQPQKMEEEILPISNNFFPCYEYIYYTQQNLDPLSKKLLENSENAGDGKLSVQEIGYFKQLVLILQSENAHQQKCSYLIINLINKLLTWPNGLILPVFDLLRVFMTHPDSEQFFSGLDRGKKIFSLIFALLRQGSNLPTPHVTLYIKVLCNCFIQNQSKISIYENLPELQTVLQHILSRNIHDNKNLNKALTDLYLNLSIEAMYRVNIDYTNIIKQQMSFANEDNIWTVLIALGNYVHSNKGYRQLVQFNQYQSEDLKDLVKAIQNC